MREGHLGGKRLLFNAVAETMDKVEKTTKRLEMTDILVELFKASPPEDVERIAYLLQGKVRPDYEGVELGLADKLVAKAISACTGASAEEVEGLYNERGDLGTAASELLGKRALKTLARRELTVDEVSSSLLRIAKTSGKGAVETKTSLLARLLANARPLEAKYVVRAVMGKLRLGVADYTVLDALSVAFTGDKANRRTLERAYNLTSDLGYVARTVAEKGLGGVEGVRISVGRPVRPMLAERLPTAQEILEKLGGRCVVEYKLDGERIQVHKHGDNVTLFSRRLENISLHYPDAIDLARAQLRCKEGILEAEGVAVNLETGELLPFQELMHRRRKYGIEEAMKTYPISLYFFDALYLDREDLTGRSYEDRRRRLEKAVRGGERVRVVPSRVVETPREIEEFMELATSEGCEGIMAKDMKSVYRAGAREWAWIKLKREYRSELTDTIDLVVVGAFHGRGRRTGLYGAFLLAAYNPDEDVFYSACKIGTGFTDVDLEAFPKLLDPYKIPHRHARVESKMEADIWFEPKVVIEVIASEITLSPVHTCGMDAIRKGSGLALRFPKYTGRLRDDTGPEDATTVKEIIEMYRGQLKKIGEGRETPA